MICAKINTSGRWPTTDELAARDLFEAALLSAGAQMDGHDCGDFSINIFITNDFDTGAIRRIGHNLGLDVLVRESEQV